MKKVSEAQPQDTFLLFLRYMSIGDYPGGLTLKSERPNLSARPISKMRETRLFLGFSEEIVQFAIDAIHRFNQAIQGTIESGLV